MHRVVHAQGSDAKSYLPKFAVRDTQRSEAYAQRLEDEHRATHSVAFTLLDEYRSMTLRSLQRSASSDVHRELVLHQRRNHTRADSEFIERLMRDRSITIKPADKNLGMVLVDTHWYAAELARMLSDRVTYQPLPATRMVTRTRGGKPAASVREPYTAAIMQRELHDQLTALITKHKLSLELWSSVHAAQIIKYLRKAVTAETCAVPQIYLLIKVHKAAGLCGRPIVPSTRWLTTPASRLADHLLQEVLRDAAIPHLVKDTKSFVVELERTPVHDGDCMLVTADIASLYTNIDTQMGLQLVRQFLIEQGVSARHSELIMDLLQFVMEHSYLKHGALVYLQIDGTAMGTSVAPTYATIVVYMLEKAVLADMRASLYLYHRFLDDVFAYVQRAAVPEFIHRMNTLHPKLRFDFVTHPTEASFLDLRIHKGARFASSRIFDLSVHQKKMNLYLYIPYNSFHTEAMKRSFIQTELMRYIRNSSDADDYGRLKQTFYERLRDRGYPSAFLMLIFGSIWYSDRPYFLWPAKELHAHPALLARPPKSLSLQRRLSRWQLQQTAVASSEPLLSPPVFVIPYSPLSHLVPTRLLLSRLWALVQDATGSPLPRPIIAYQSETSLHKRLVYQRDRLFAKADAAEAARAAPPPAPAMRQPTLHAFMAPIR